MSEPGDDVLEALRALGAEVAELLRFEHESGGIGLLEHPIHAERDGASERTARPERVRRGSPELLAPAPEGTAAAPARGNRSSALHEVESLLEASRRARARASPAPIDPAPADVSREGERRVALATLAAEAAACTACRLHESRTKSVFSRGSPDAELAFIGEGPGQNEDLRGEPFVGAAGQLLDRMIEAMGLTRDAVYIANAVKCRPPNNRTPQPDEVRACAPFLDAQLDLVRPRVIVALGKTAAERLGCVVEGQGWRGRWNEYRGIPVMPTYHPAFLLRSPEMKRPVWEDLQAVLARLRAAR